MFIRRIMNHTYVHVNQFGNSAYLISTLLPEARLTGCEIVKPDADLTEPTIAPAPLLRRYLARDPPSGKSDANPVPQRSDEHKSTAERYVEGVRCPFCWRSKNRAYKYKLSECKSKLKRHENAYLAYTSRELCFAVEYDTSSAASVFDGEPIATDRVSSLSTNQLSSSHSKRYNRKKTSSAAAPHVDANSLRRATVSQGVPPSATPTQFIAPYFSVPYFTVQYFSLVYFIASFSSHARGATNGYR